MDTLKPNHTVKHLDNLSKTLEDSTKILEHSEKYVSPPPSTLNPYYEFMIPRASTENVDQTVAAVIVICFLLLSLYVVFRVRKGLKTNKKKKL